MKILTRIRVRRDEGATLVEFAIVTVLLVIVLLSVVEMGRMILVYTAMANAARAGARYAMVHGFDRSGSGADGPSGPPAGSTSCSPCTQVATVVQNYASAGLIDGSNVTTTVTYPNKSNAPGSPVQVTVQYTYDPLLAGYFGSILNTTLSSTSEAVITF